MPGIGMVFTLEGQGDGLFQFLQLFGQSEVCLSCRSRIGNDVSLPKCAGARHDSNWNTM